MQPTLFKLQKKLFNYDPFSLYFFKLFLKLVSLQVKSKASQKIFEMLVFLLKHFNFKYVVDKLRKCSTP